MGLRTVGWGHWGIIRWMQRSHFCICIPLLRSLAINSWLLVSRNLLKQSPNANDFCQLLMVEVECWLLTAKVCSKLPEATWVAGAAAGGAGMPVLILSYLLFLASLLWRQAGLCPPPPPGNFAIFYDSCHISAFFDWFSRAEPRLQCDDWSRYRTTSWHIFLGYKTHFIKTFGETWYENHIKIFET